VSRSIIEVRSADVPLLVPAYGGCLNRDEQGATSMPTLEGHFSVWNEWARIAESGGEFMERVAPGAFAASLTRQRPKILFNHGRDPRIGGLPLAVALTVREDERGGFYSAPLLDTAYVAELLPGLRAGAYGASFRFKVMREDWDEYPSRSTFNPDGLRERTIRAADVFEIGPVVFPAYAGATAGVRSLTDLFAEATTAA
jgi:HK97 family phage prohead protease